MDRPRIRQSQLPGVRLPVFRPAALQVIDICRAEIRSPSDLIETIRLDPVLTAMILTDVADARIHALTVEEAVAKIGMESVPAILLATVCDALTQETSDDNAKCFDIEAYWEHSVACSLYAEALAACMDGIRPDLAATAGLLHDIGKLALHCADPVCYDQALGHAEQTDLTVEEAERSILGTDHGLAGRWILEYWNLPAPLIEAVWLHHHSLPDSLQPEDRFDLTTCVHLANMMAHEGPVADREQPALESGLHKIGISETHVHRIRAQVSEKLNHIKTSMLSADVEPESDRDAPGDAFILLQRHIRRLSHTRQAQQHRIMQLDAVNQFIPALSSMDLGQILGRLVDNMLKGLDLQAVQCEIRLADGVTLRRKIHGRHRDASNAMTHTIAINAREWGTGTLTAFHDPALHTSFVASGLTLFADIAAMTIELVERYRRALNLSDRYIHTAPAPVSLEASHRRNEALKDLNAVTAQMAHIFNNLFTGILGRTQLLLISPGDPEKLTEGLDKIEQIVHRGTQTIRLLQLSSHSDSVPVSELVDINDLIGRVIGEHTDEMSERNIDITTDLDRSLPLIMGRTDELHIMLSQLMRNAIEAMPSGGTLAIRTASDSQTLTIGVSDTGTGIPAEIQDSIFDVLFTTKGPDHNGLGLSAVRGIVRRHTGQISVVSEERQGTTFLITFSPPQDGPEAGSMQSVVSESISDA